MSSFQDTKNCQKDVKKEVKLQYTRRLKQYDSSQ